MILEFLKSRTTVILEQQNHVLERRDCSTRTVLNPVQASVLGNPFRKPNKIGHKDWNLMHNSRLESNRLKIIKTGVLNYNIKT